MESKNRVDENTLDISLIHDFMDLINDNEMFINRKDLKEKYNLICTFKDRLFTAVDYLNEHSMPPTKELDFINYMVYADMLYEGIKCFYENLFHCNPDYVKTKKYFRWVKHHKKYYFTEETCPYDYVFFEYLRAMVFAHPYGVDKKRCKDRYFMMDGETHYCPWVIAKSIYNFDGIADSVGIRIYSNKHEDDIVDLTFSFNSLRAFIKNVYSGINDFMKWAKEEIDEQNKEWKQTKVNREQDDISILKEIKIILESRFVEVYSIDRALSYLTCKTTIESNNNNVEVFRKKIVECIPAICDSVDNLDYEAMEDALSVIYSRPKNMHQMAHYQLEKIYSYLDERSENIDPASNEYWGLEQAKLFAQKFAKKWVTIDVETMEYDEIKLLVAVSCYLEREEQEKKKQEK